MAAEAIRLAVGSVSAFLALMFLRAALHKAADLTRFEGSLADYALLPDWSLRTVRLLIPGLELACAAALAWGGARAVGAQAAAALLLGYGAAMAVNLARGRSEIDCGCGGPPERLSWALVARNLGLAAALIPATLGLSDPRGWDEALASWSIAAVAFCCWGATAQLLANQGRMAADRREAANWTTGAVR